MANHPEDPIIETIDAESNSEHEDLGVQILNPEQLAQENQVLKGKVGAMEAQMCEMMAMLQSLKSGTAAEGVAVVSPDGATSFVPPPVSASATTTVPPGFGVGNSAFTSGMNMANQYTPQRYPWGMPAGYMPQTVGPIPVSTNAPNQVTAAVSAGAAGGPQIPTPVSLAVPSPIPGMVAPPHNAPQLGGYYYSIGSHPQGHMLEGPQSNDPIRALEERVRAMEGVGVRAKEARELCLVPDLVLPPKFKAPEVDKYRGTGCPVSHITMFVRKMGPYANDDKLLIYCFQNSLAGAPLDWYMKLQSSEIRCWKDLSEAFMRQYKYNMDMAPDRSQLQHMCKGEKETFKEYAQKWRSTAAQVQPPLTEKEMVYMFLETLPAVYYDRLITSVSTSFSDMIVFGERLEHGLRSGKISNHLSNAGSSGGSNSQKKYQSHFPKKKEGETNVISGGNSSFGTPPPQVVPFSASMPSQQGSDNHKAQGYQYKKRVSFDPIPMTYTELFNHLTSQNLISTRSMKPLQPPFPRSYNANATCSFHENGVGHTVEDCKAFKHVVQDLIDAGWITFKQNSPNTTTDPLPSHQRPAANAIESAVGQLLRKVQEIKTPLSVIYAELCQAEVVKEGCCREEGCADSLCIGNCESFKRILQDLMDRCVVQIGTHDIEGEVVTLHSNNDGKTRKQIVTEDTVPFSCEEEINEEVTAVPVKEGCWDTLGEPSGKFDYLVRYDAPESAQIRMEDIQPTGWDEEEEQHNQCAVIKDVSEFEEVWTLHSDEGRGIRKPIEIPYNFNPRLVRANAQPIVIEVPAPFPYESDRAVPWRYTALPAVEHSPSVPAVTNIAGASGITRSGRVFAPETLRGETSKEGEQTVRKDKGKEPEVVQENATEKEANEFLKIVRQSDYRVVDQLKQTPSKISMLSLLLSSEAHRTALMKVLSEAHVAEDVSVNQFDEIVGNIVAANHLTFADDELPSSGKEHNQALHISVKCGDYVLARVLIDNGSSLNVMPKTTMDKLDVDCSYMKPSSTLVRAFDGSKKEVLGEMEFPIQIGPEVFYINFQIMDITSSYSCLLGRPWIHMAGAIPSSLHQRVKFVVGDQVVVVFGEEETLVNKPSEFKYVEAAEESLETAFQSLEIAHAAVEKTKEEEMVAKIMLAQGYKVGSGLGKSGQGILAPIQLKENKDRRGLGYTPSEEEGRKKAEERRDRWLARSKGQDPWPQGIPICDIHQSFVSAGLLDHDQIAVIKDGSESEGGIGNLIRRCITGEELKNWEAAAFPVIFNSK